MHRSLKLSLSHLYSLKTKISQCHYVAMYYILHNDMMRFSVVGFRSDIRVKLQAPVASVYHTEQDTVDSCKFEVIGTRGFIWKN